MHQTVNLLPPGAQQIERDSRALAMDIGLVCEGKDQRIVLLALLTLLNGISRCEKPPHAASNLLAATTDHALHLLMAQAIEAERQGRLAPPAKQPGQTVAQ